MARIFFCGDNHGVFEHVLEAVRSYRPAAVVFLGDLQPQRPLELELQRILDLTEVWWIHGNHDTDSDVDYRNLFGSALADRNLHGRVSVIAGLRIAGLGGIFRGSIWWPGDASRFRNYAEYALMERNSPGQKRRLSKMDLVMRQSVPSSLDDSLQEATTNGRLRKHRSSIFPDDYACLMGRRADILVTHEAPSCHPHGFDAIDELARSLGARATFHGHHHDRLDYSGHRERLDFSAYGVGLCGITDQDGRVIRAGEFDGLRKYRQDSS